MAETVGWLADKISIIELKIYHMLEQAARTDKPVEFREQCLARVAVMREQRDDLTSEMAILFDDIVSGRIVPKVYRQYKMYNDPQFRKRT